MAKKFMSIKKIIIPALTVCMMITQSLPAFANTTDTAQTDSIVIEMVEDDVKEDTDSSSVITETEEGDYVYSDLTMSLDNSKYINTLYEQTPTDVTQFSDYNINFGYGQIKGHWAEDEIQTLLSMGGIAGVPYGITSYRFEADRSVNTNELLSIILRVSGNKPADSENWSDSVMAKSVELGLIPASMQSEGNVPLTREKMAMILINAEANIRGKSTTTTADGQSVTSFVPSKISDLNEADPAYQTDIVTAYALGLLAGTGNGYNPKGITTRAETCAIVNRLFEYTERVDNMPQEEVMLPETPETPQTQGTQYAALPDGSNVGIYWNCPAEGLIGPDGNIITRDPETGVLGFGNGQTGGIWNGLTYPNGVVIGEGSTAGPTTAPYTDDYKDVSGQYENHGGYTYWTQEWNRIYGVGQQKLNSENAGAPEGSVADINGNIVSGSVEDDNVHYVKQYGTWCIKAW